MNLDARYVHAPTRAAVLALALTMVPASVHAQPLVPRWDYHGHQSSSHLGWSIAGGDWNGDGLGDLAVGIPLADRGEVDEGIVYVFYGTPLGLSLTPGWDVDSNQAGAMYGYVVANGGDLDSDGIDDLVVGAPLYDNGQVDEGLIFVYSGSEEGLSPFPSFSREMNQAGAMFGAAIAAGADVDFDGANDLAVGAPRWTNGQAGEGRVFLFRGEFFTGVETNPSWSVESNQAHAHLGHSLAFSDVDGDYLADLVVGAPEFSGARSHEGRVTIYRGSEDDALETSPEWTLFGGRVGARFGYSLAGLVDVDGNGYGDLLVGAPGWGSPGRVLGAAFVFLGDEMGLDTKPWWTIQGDQVEGGLGYALADVGDVDADGFTDFALGAPGASVQLPREGRISVYIGAEQDAAPHLAGVFAGGQAGGAFGISISSADALRDYDAKTEVFGGGLHFDGGLRSQGLARMFSLGHTVVGVESPAPSIGLAIERIHPNPSRHRMNVAFRLPADGSTTLELIDIAGRRRVHHALGMLPGGRHTVDALTGIRLEPGLYFVRLTHGSRTVTAKATILE